MFKGISFEVRKGEILGIGGLVGSRRTETLEALFGLRPMTEGKIFLNGKQYFPKNPRQAIKNRIAYVTEDRKKSGLVLCLPVYENINLIHAQEPSFAGYLNWSKLGYCQPSPQNSEYQSEPDRATSQFSIRR